MKKENFNQLRESLYSETLENGLRVYLIPKKGFSSTCGIYATQFGNLLCNSKILVDGKYQPMQSGMAHFLEHRLFDYKQGNVVDIFSAYGAMCNAFTSYDKTAYYFTTSQNVEECVNTLLDFVGELNVSKESVEKEKEIIVQELNMYLDNPDIVLSTGSFQRAYHHHMIKDDIGGTEETVRNTTLELLQSAHQTFYHPSNMIFVLVGDFDEEKMMEFIRENQKTKEVKQPLPYKKSSKKEPLGIVEAVSSIKMDVAFDKCSLLYKLPKVRSNTSPKKVDLDSLSGEVFLDLLFSRSGHVSQYLLDNKMIALPMNAYYHNTFKSANFAAISADVLDEEGFVRVVKESIKDADRFITKEAVENQKRSMIGEYLNTFNDTERIGVDFLSDDFNGLCYFDKLNNIDKVTVASVKKIAHKISASPVSQFSIYKRN